MADSEPLRDRSHLPGPAEASAWRIRGLAEEAHPSCSPTSTSRPPKLAHDSLRSASGWTRIAPGAANTDAGFDPRATNGGPRMKATVPFPFGDPEELVGV